MWWYEAIVKHYHTGNDDFKVATDRVIVHARDYAGAVAAIMEDYGEELHSFLIGEAIEGDFSTYTCDRSSDDRFCFLEDWNTEDIK